METEIKHWIKREKEERGRGRQKRENRVTLYPKIFSYHAPYQYAPSSAHVLIRQYACTIFRVEKFPCLRECKRNTTYRNDAKRGAYMRRTYANIRIVRIPLCNGEDTRRCPARVQTQTLEKSKASASAPECHRRRHGYLYCSRSLLQKPLRQYFVPT